MSGVNGRGPLSVADLLGLAEQRKVARVDLAEAGYGGVVFVCDLTAAQQQRIMSGPRKGKTRVYRDNSYDLDWSDLPQDAASKFLEACLVTDREGGATLARAFEAADGDGEVVEFITFPASELVYVAELMTAELKQARLVRDKLEQWPNAVTSLIIKKMRQISGLAEDRIEEKKEHS